MRVKSVKDWLYILKRVQYGLVQYSILLSHEKSVLLRNGILLMSASNVLKFLLNWCPSVSRRIAWCVHFLLTTRILCNHHKHFCSLYDELCRGNGKLLPNLSDLINCIPKVCSTFRTGCILKIQFLDPREWSVPTAAVYYPLWTWLCFTTAEKYQEL